MNAETMINLVIWFLVAVLMIGIGISNLRSNRPVGFYTGERPPEERELTDVRAWNQRHGWMWIFYGIVIIISAGIGNWIGNHTIWCLLPYLGGTMLPILLMIWYHHKLIKRYKK